MIPIFIIAGLFIVFKIFVLKPSTSYVITVMEAFTVGALLGDVFFHSLPHLIADVKGCEDSMLGYFWVFCLGIVISYLIEVLTNKVVGHHSHDDHGHKQPK